MRSLSSCPLLLAALCVLLSSAPENSGATETHPEAAETKAIQISWYRGSFEKALEEAAFRNVPVVVLVMQDKEESCERILADVLAEPSIQRHFKRVVAILGAREQHAEKRSRKGTHCVLYGSLPCQVHQAHHQKIYRRLFQGTVMKVPTAVFCKPDLEVIVKLEDESSAHLFDQAFKQVARAVGPGLSRSELKAYRISMTRARNHLAKQRFGAALSELGDLPKISSKSVLAKRVAALQAEAERGCKADIGLALTDFRAGRHFEALVSLDLLVKQLGSLKTAALAKATLKKMAKTPEGKSAMRRIKRDRKLQVLSDKAEATLSKGRVAAAVRAWLLVVERGSDLPTAQRAVKRLEAFRDHPKAGPMIKAYDQEKKAVLLYTAAKLARKEGNESRVAKLLAQMKKEHPKAKATRRAIKSLGGSK